MSRLIARPAPVPAPNLPPLARRTRLASRHRGAARALLQGGGDIRDARPRPRLAGLRRLAAIGVGLAALALGTGARADPAGDVVAAFDAQCARLPTSRFTVLVVPIAYAIDESRTIDQLTRTSGHAIGRQMTLGLTTAHFGYTTTLNVMSVENPGLGRACATLDVEATLSMQPVQVFLAQELDAASCARQATLEHEQKHVAVHEAMLAEAASELATALPAALGQELQRGPSRTAIERQANARLTEYLDAFMRRRQQDLDVRQDRVDSPEEFARVKAACPR